MLAASTGWLICHPGPNNDGSGRQNYFGNAVDHRDAILMMEGLAAHNYNVPPAVRHQRSDDDLGGW